MKFDERTGLPEAPEGLVWWLDFSVGDTYAYLWLVDPENENPRDWELEGIYGNLLDAILNKGLLLPKHKVRPRHIRAAARKLLRNRANRMLLDEKALAVAALYEGYYPPKRLDR